MSLICTVIIIVLLAMTPRSEMHSASFVFGSEGMINSTAGWNSGVAFLFGLLSVQWTVSRRQRRPAVKLTVLFR